MVVKVQGATHVSSVPAAPGDIDSVLARLDAPPNPTATLPPGTPLKRIPRPGEPGAPLSQASIDAILIEIRALKKTQDEILALLRARPGAPESMTLDDDDRFDRIDDEAAPEPAPTPVRTRRRKTVLIIDDDEPARKAAIKALETAEVPVKMAVDGNGGLAAIAMEKPDVIVMELGMAGPMAGKDVINMIKATMEWVDIPIVLYTSLPIENQREARTVHGADELVAKGPGSADALVAKVISIFRRG
jgi:CheY-like chemotaxis protein